MVPGDEIGGFRGLLCEYPVCCIAGVWLVFGLCKIMGVVLLRRIWQIPKSVG